MAHDPEPEMEIVSLRVADLYEFSGSRAPASPNLEEVTALALKQFSFLPQPARVQLEGDLVTVSYPKESATAQTEAARLAQRAATRASGSVFSNPAWRALPTTKWWNCC